MGRDAIFFIIFILVVVGAAWLFFLGAVFIEDWPNCAKRILSWRKGHRIDLGIGGSLSHSGGLEEGTDIAIPPPAYVSSRNRNPEGWAALDRSVGPHGVGQEF